MTNFVKLLYALVALNAISYVAALLDDDTIYGGVLLSGKEGTGWVAFNYSLDECIEQGYCPDYITTTKEDFWRQIGTLSPSFLADTFSALNTTFKIPMFYRGSPGEERDWKIFVPYKVFLRRNKYTAMVIIYSIMAIGLLLVHHSKQRLSLEYQFKLSKLSKLMLNYLAFKTVFKLIYLALMFAYVTGDTIKFSLSLVYLSCEDYIQGPVTFALAVLFAMGYGTRRFKIDASMAWKTALLTACNILLTLPGLFQALLVDWKILESVWFELPFTILYYALIAFCCYIGYNTYKVNKDQRYLDSAKAIIIGVLLNPFFLVPEDLWSTKFFLFEVVVRSRKDISYGMAIPDLIELVVIIYLIYVWRDIREEDLGSIQLENIET